MFLSLLAVIISSAYSIELQCKKWRKEICFNSNIVIKEKAISIQFKTDENKVGIKTLFLKEAVVFFLPVNISQEFPNLKVLKVINSSLTEFEKSNFAGLEKITEVNFERNLITNLPADALYLLESLTKINLNYNNISDIPAKIFSNNLNLTEISFIGNRIEQLHDQTFKNLVNLNYIFLSDNNIEDLRGGTFDDCTELKVISISNNKLKYAPINIFDKNNKLTFSKKNFENNKCIDSYLKKSSLEKFEDLKDALKDNCKPHNQAYIDELKEKNEKLEKELKKLSNEFAKAEKKVTEANEKLVRKSEELIELQKNKDKCDKELAPKDQKILELSGKVEELTKDSNNLTSSSSNCQTSLKAKELANSDLEMEIKSCKTLLEECKDINYQTLNHLGSEAVKIHKFEVLNKNLTAELEVLRLQAADKDKIIADNTQTIQKSDIKLRINEMTIEFIMNGYKEANKTIEALNKTSCSSKLLTPIAETESTNFYNIDCKFEDNFSRNDKFYTCSVNDVKALNCNAKSKEISSNSNGKTVTGISISDSQFIDFPTVLAEKFKNFEYFKISKSVFGKFVENICKLSSEIEVLSVMSSIVGDSIKLDQCMKLKTLQIESSGIKTISAANPIKTLTNIALRGNKIEEISKEFFSKFENLKSIQMPENKISYLNGNTFDGNKLLETVNLSKNPIKKINGEIFSQNSKLVSIDFKQLDCINKAEYNKNKIDVIKREIVEKCG